jgi:outer membrane protein OmpA-like peptidoglycan-associated protein/tetratricopeptide (TPR) repeat protein
MEHQHTIPQILKHSLKSFSLLLFTLLFSCASMAQDLSTDSRRAAKLFEEGQSLYQRHQHQEAEKMLLEALEKDNFVEARTLLGYVYLDLMQYQKAKAQFAQAIDINAKAIPNNLFFLAELELKDGEYESAQKHFNAFLESNPQNSEQLNRSKNGLEVIDFALKAQKNPVPFEPKNLGPSFNSEQAEYFPSLTVDGNTLLFTRRLPSKSSPMGYNEDFYLAQRNEKGHWQKAQNMGQPINTANNEGAPSFSADGNMLIFTACELYGDYGGNRKGYGSCDLFITFKGDANLWGKPKNLGSTINSAHWETQPSFSADGKTLYFVQGKRNRSGSQNGNIYVSRLNEEGRWTVPQALSNKINTIGNEESVFIHPDGKTLYFSSDGHLGMGGLDIFMSQKDSSGEWSEPLNLGYPINTHKNENSLLVSPDGELAYFASDRKEGYGDLDLYSFELPEQFKPNPVSYFAGNIFDKETKAPLSARFQLIDLESGETVVESYSNINGDFLMALPAGKDYALNVSKSGYLFYSDNFSLTQTSDNKAFRKNVPLSPIKVGEKIVLNNIFFETAKYTLKKQSKIELSKVVQFLEENPSLKIEVSGHTDNVGSDESNLKLSKNRAKSVVDYLVQEGIESSRIRSKGYGSTQPIADNDTKAGKAKNRRTEFEIIAL